MKGEKSKAHDGEVVARREVLAAHAGQFVDWLLGGVKEAMGPTFPEAHAAGVKGAAADMMATEPLYYENEREA